MKEILFNMKVKEVLNKQVEKLNKYNIEDSILKGQILLEYVLGISHKLLIMQYEEKIPNAKIREYERLIVDLINGKPIQYIVNNQCFYGYDFYVDENVLIPQPDTECLVEEVINIHKNLPNRAKILDLCTGSGAIAISIRKNVDCTMYASDISQEAISVAKRNTVINNAEVSFIHSDMFENISDKFNAIVSNPPYIETDILKTLSKEVRNEPMIALDGGEDGLRFYREIADKSREYLEDDGILAVEIGYNQKEKVMKIFEDCNFYDIYSKKDFGGNDRIVLGRWRK